MASSSEVTEEKQVFNAALWLECAGPLVRLPTVGSHVVYFPQGHGEQVAASIQTEVELQIPSYPNLGPQLICQLHSMTLHADQENDEVYAQMMLQPVKKEQDINLELDFETQTMQSKLSFSKTLTPSDTSTHGGFSIPRRAAEKVFPPLDFTKQPPAQEIIARDLHNKNWPFRHIYRGQPRRHLLTTGWSVFISAKRLQAGDTVVFMRGENGEIYLGTRRQHNQLPATSLPLLTSDSMLIGLLAAAAMNKRFTIYYKPRASISAFVIPLAKYNKAIFQTQIYTGMRFRMELENEDSTTRNYTGTITGISDLDPIRWPNSHWRKLRVIWDESPARQRQLRLSMWEIGPISAPLLICHPLLSFSSKRPKLVQAPVQAGSGQAIGDEEEVESMIKKTSPFACGDEHLINGQNAHSSIVGSEQWMQFQQGSNSESLTVQLDNDHILEAAAPRKFQRSDSSKQSSFTSCSLPTVSSEKMFAGQRLIHPQLGLPIQIPQHHLNKRQQQQQHMIVQSNLETKLQPTLGAAQSAAHLPTSFESILSESNRTTSSFSLSNLYPLPDHLARLNPSNFVLDENNHNSAFLRSDKEASMPSLVPQESWEALNCWVSFVKDTNLSDAQNSRISGITSSISGSLSVLPDAHASCEALVTTRSLQQFPCTNTFQALDPLHCNHDHFRFGVSIDSLNDPATPSFFISKTISKDKDLHNGFLGVKDNASSLCSSSEVEIPSVLLTKDSHGCGLVTPLNHPRLCPSSVRTYTKVYKSRSVGRSVDLNRFKCYDELRNELAVMFKLEGLLEDPQRLGWQLVFVDNENDVLLVGDDPWEEFVNLVRFIKILSPSEVLKMNQEGLQWMNSIPGQLQTSGSSEDWQESQNQNSFNFST
ncbi:hypothetical protein O6H91_15G040400 [Diphasiastrum complanatum]|uniref:Uncharacterized protein n=2 Tax=Diphasiastrum complanatum TaxID=34168 RepID=A0ACC2BHJ7_DIPCM|nr:hypothetical protein O6H91_15G040400 [Diphasiastrum complanatum]KAJ7529259.1 hypothetical protein O6H91_15G040400 [Diphasiastrum complanatum]